MKEKQKEFAKKLASYADCYVMDAFGTAHRKHASTAVIADYFADDDKMLGLLMEKEVSAVDNVLSNIKRPFVAIMGGSKVSSTSSMSLSELRIWQRRTEWSSCSAPIQWLQTDWISAL